MFIYQQVIFQASITNYKKVKLNIEMSMADLIVKTARGSEIDMHPSSSDRRPFPDPTKSSTRNPGTMTGHDYVGGAQSSAHAGHVPQSQLDRRDDDPKGITRQTEVQVYVNDSDSDSSLEDQKQHRHHQEEEESKNSLERTQSRQSHGSQIPLKDLPARGPYSIV